MTASTQAVSIKKAIASFGAEKLTPQQKKRLAEAQIEASGHINSALGEARRGQERDGAVSDGN
jgi:hypothetical protein